MRIGDNESKKTSLIQLLSVGILLSSGVLTITFILSGSHEDNLYLLKTEKNLGRFDQQKRNIASDCHRGMKYIVGNQITDQADESKGYQKCPENCAGPDDFPGYDPNNPTSFSRDQDEVGMCGAFSAADYIGHKLSQFKRWPASPDYDRGVSAFDLEIQAFAKENDQPDKNTIKNFLGPDARESGKWDNSILKNPEDYLKNAEAFGVCPENAMPSEFRANGRITPVRAIYEALQAHLKELKNRTEAGVGLPGICKECGLVAPGLSDEQWKKVADALAAVKNFDQDNFQVLKKIDEIACEGKRVPVPKIFDMQPMGFDVLEDWMTQSKSVVAMSVHAKPLDPDHIKPGPGETNEDYDKHSVIVYGATIKNVNGKNICFFKVKNSWGPNACASVWGNKNSPDIQCDAANGSYLVSAATLKSMELSIQQ